MHNMPLLDKDVILVNEKLFEMINCYYSQTWKKLGRYTYHKQENERWRWLDISSNGERQRYTMEYECKNDA